MAGIFAFGNFLEFMGWNRIGWVVKIVGLGGLWHSGNMGKSMMGYESEDGCVWKNRGWDQPFSFQSRSLCYPIIYFDSYHACRHSSYHTIAGGSFAPSRSPSFFYFSPVHSLTIYYILVTIGNILSDDMLQSPGLRWGIILLYEIDVEQSFVLFHKVPETCHFIHPVPLTPAAVPCRARARA